MEHRDQLNPSWTADVKTTWVWEYERFCTNVNNLWLSVDREQTKNTITNLFSNHMVIVFNIFATFIKYKIGS